MKKKAKRPTALLGDRDDAEVAHGSVVQGHPLVREAGLRRVPCPRGVECLATGFS